MRRPFLVLYVVWHPDYSFGERIARHLLDHFGRGTQTNDEAAIGLDVSFRSSQVAGSAVPIPIDFTSSETSAVIVLVDGHLANDPAWTHYIHQVTDDADAAGLASRVIPVAIEPGVLRLLGVSEQALRWDTWPGSQTRKLQHLTSRITYDFSRMLRHYLEHLRRPGTETEELEQYLEKVRVFLSHSKHDPDGERIATEIRTALLDDHGMDAFFDVYDIPAGLKFHKVLLKRVQRSTMIAIHTDSYSSREWCRKEIIEAKRWNVPLIVANCLHDVDERGFPYLGNVPIVRMDPKQELARIDNIIGRLLDEVLRDYLWQCRTFGARSAHPDVVFVPRLPELILLASLPSVADGQIVVYPDPPLSAEEERLFEQIAPGLQLRSLTEWASGAIR